MNALDLKQYLAKYTDDELSKLEVVRPSSDHSYYKSPSVTITEAEKTKDRHLFEYFEDYNMSPGSTKVQVLLIG